MIRSQLVKKNVGQSKNFRWRGEDVSRIEALSDAVFAFAVTLIVVSLEVPKTFSDLRNTLTHGIIAFAISFVMLMQVWLWHYSFFRRYGLRDRQTLLLNIALLFVILFYIYPLKFLFLLLSDQLLGLGTGSMIQDAQWPSLMIIYSLGFLAVQCVFALLYSHAYRKRTELELNETEVYLTWRSILSYLLLAGVGLISIFIAAFGGLDYVSWSGWIYMLIIPLQVLLYLFLRQRKIAAYQTAEHIH